MCKISQFGGSLTENLKNDFIHFRKNAPFIKFSNSLYLFAGMLPYYVSVFN